MIYSEARSVFAGNKRFSDDFGAYGGGGLSCGCGGNELGEDPIVGRDCGIEGLLVYNGGLPLVSPPVVVEEAGVVDVGGNSFASVCFCLCFVRYEAELKHLRQTSHLNNCSPVCDFLWVLRYQEEE